MKNNLLIFFLINIFIIGNSFANEFRFETSKIDIKENGDLILAENGKAKSKDNEIEIEALKFIYKKKLNLLEAFNGTALIKTDDIKIVFTEIRIDQKNIRTIPSEEQMKAALEIRQWALDEGFAFISG